MLGPALFLIFINDLDTGSVNHILKFADDTKVFGNINHVIDSIKLQEDLNELFNWSKDWQMKFNVDKCNGKEESAQHILHEWHSIRKY